MKYVSKYLCQVVRLLGDRDTIQIILGIVLLGISVFTGLASNAFRDLFFY